MALLLNAIRLALSAIARNKTRSALTVLGILIGVAAVVTVTALATAASDLVGGSIDSFASNAIYITPQQSQQKGVKRSGARLTDNDGRAIAREAVSVTDVASFSSTDGSVIYGDKNIITSIVGTQLPYYRIRKYKVSRGTTWTPTDELLKTKVCVVGITVANELFGTEDPVGKVIRVGHAPYRVIGVLEQKGTSPFGDDQDDRIMMPIGSYRARVMHMPQGRTDMVMASATGEETTDGAMSQITSILRQRHHIAEGMDPDFRISSQAEFRQAERGIATVLSALLMGVAAISLIVGGVGVMNIMLVSVSERTREIGIRMSIGAREGDIRTQFLVEAVVLSTVGGIAGVAVGMVSAFGLGFILDWRVVPRFDALAVALTTSAVIGIAFGFLPARRAARMDPIDALRTE